MKLQVIQLLAILFMKMENMFYIIHISQIQKVNTAEKIQYNMGHVE
jgi:hypothetical protein